MSDKLAKSLDNHLSYALENDNAARRRLRRRGWKEFVDTDHPDTDDAVQMAVSALCYIGIHDGQWTYEERLIAAVFAFLEMHTGFRPQKHVGELGAILTTNPVDEEAVAIWFDDAYPR